LSWKAPTSVGDI
jgi:hypothetical protein